MVRTAVLPLDLRANLFYSQPPQAGRRSQNYTPNMGLNAEKQAVEIKGTEDEGIDAGWSERHINRPSSVVAGIMIRMYCIYIGYTGGSFYQA